MYEIKNPWEQFVISTVEGMPDESLHANIFLSTYQYGSQILPFAVTGKFGRSVVIIPKDYPRLYRKALKKYRISFIVTKPEMTSRELEKLIRKKQVVLSRTTKYFSHSL